jgi:Holliday junction DNA helicase RuvA
MISHLTGRIIAKKPIYIVLDVNGVGYRVYCSDKIVEDLTIGDEISVHTHLVVREDVLDIYGFGTEDELSLFVMLISVSGIGPRSALGIMSLESFDKLLGAISQEDVGYLTKVSGIGKKSAEKIVLELKDKVDVFDVSGFSETRREEEDVLEALRTLGYRADEARNALRQVPAGIKEQGDIIKEALKILS